MSETRKNYLETMIAMSCTITQAGETLGKTYDSIQKMRKRLIADGLVEFYGDQQQRVTKKGYEFIGQTTPESAPAKTPVVKTAPVPTPEPIEETESPEEHNERRTISLDEAWERAKARIATSKSVVAESREVTVNSNITPKRLTINHRTYNITRQRG
jgi:hypothetical protein